MLACSIFLFSKVKSLKDGPTTLFPSQALNPNPPRRTTTMTTSASTTTTTKTILSTAASLAATAVLIRSITNELIPKTLQSYLSSSLSSLRARLSSQLTIIIDESNGMIPNHMYTAAQTYLSTKLSPTTTHRIRVAKHGVDSDSDSLEVTMETGEEITDLFEGTQFQWRLISRETHYTAPHRRFHDDGIAVPIEIRFFELTFHKKHKNMALGSYLPYVLRRYKAIRDETKTLKLCTIYKGRRDSPRWTAVNLHHPATFETVAMEPELKRAVMEDLQRFVGRKEYYRRIGKAWKRGYLLYGPPGTGKSSMIAAMANYLKFDVFDLELNEVRSNANLRELLLRTTNKSILVVEDIDCSTVEMQNREGKERSNSKEKRAPDEDDDKVTLSGLLNFVDGLWSSCGDERIIVFTTNYKDRLDPALLRPGRMDMHIYMTYCSPYGFKVLASNYLAVNEHPLFSDIEGLIQEVEVTPAEVAEELMRSDDAEIALQGLINFLHGKKDIKIKNKEGSVEGQVTKDPIDS